MTVAKATTVALPGPATAAAGDSARVWCVAGGRLLAFSDTGKTVCDAAAPPGAGALAAGPGTLVAATADGAVLWLDPADGRELARAPVAAGAQLTAGQGGTWAVDPAAGRAWRLGAPGEVQPVRTPGLLRAAADGERLWWIGDGGQVLNGGPRPLALEPPLTRAAGAMTVCANALWISVEDGLQQVGTWAGRLGPLLPAAGPALTHLACAGGVLAGARDRHSLLVLDPSIDAGLRSLDVDLGGDPAFLVATRNVACAFPAGEPEARIVPVHPA